MVANVNNKMAANLKSQYNLKIASVLALSFRILNAK